MNTFYYKTLNILYIEKEIINELSQLLNLFTIYIKNICKFNNTLKITIEHI